MVKTAKNRPSIVRGVTKRENATRLMLMAIAMSSSDMSSWTVAFLETAP